MEDDARLQHARWLLVYAIKCLLLSRVFDAKRAEIEATGLCQWGYRRFVCPECGPTAVDEDGCCGTCGADTELEEDAMDLISKLRKVANAHDGLVQISEVESLLKRGDGLAGEIEAVLNKYSAENGSNTPDFILAEYLMACLKAFETASNAREQWYGTKLAPGAVMQGGESGGNGPDPVAHS